MSIIRPLAQIGPKPLSDTYKLAGGLSWFREVETKESVLPCAALSEAVLQNFSQIRAPICALTLDEPRIMGILNVTPDSFSDGGRFSSLEETLKAAQKMSEEGADILDIGGESTRPGADFVEEADEIARVVPVIKALRENGLTTPISIDTRKPRVAVAAIKAGANIWNDVSALTWSKESMDIARDLEHPICVMHAQGDPKTMQEKPHYNNVLEDVFNFLSNQIERCENAGIKREKLIIDPGIGFGKTQEHNLELLQNLSVFHGLGCPILLGVSRKRFIGTLGHEDTARARFPGSIAVGLDGLRQGVQILRVHDVKETKQALSLWKALAKGAEK